MTDCHPFGSLRRQQVMAPPSQATGGADPAPDQPVGHRYLIGLGSNLQPAANLALARRCLEAIAGRLLFGAEVVTQPVAMISDHLFHNQVAYLETPMDPTALKCCFNALETAMGRDRRDALCKVKDRPIDLDILAVLDPAVELGQLLAAPWLDQLIREAPDYNRPLLQDLVALLRAQPPAPADWSAMAH